MPKVRNNYVMLVTSLPNICFPTKWCTKYFFVYRHIKRSGRWKSGLVNGVCTRLFGVNRDSSVDIATRYGLDGPVIESQWVARFSAPVQTRPGVHPVSYKMGTVFFPGEKRSGRGVDHTNPSSVEILLGLRWLLYGELYLRNRLLGEWQLTGSAWKKIECVRV